VLRRFIGVFARPEHPLALFLDDLQWLDAATLDFLQDLLTQPDVHHLMLIGAYRDNEVDSTHPLWRKLDAIRQAGARLHEIVLAPLTSEDLGRLLVDTVHCEPERVTPLAHLVHDKTAGNPFFAAGILQHEYRTVPVASNCYRSGSPRRMKIFSQRIRLLQRLQNFRRGILRQRRKHENLRRVVLTPPAIKNNLIILP
jgi:predicted ATPase